jgi:UDP-N-acetylmuramyl pentapeptide phosphotransferase/UDP-N-acetylglucosamine-1-phosphate transferase
MLTTNIMIKYLNSKRWRRYKTKKEGKRQKYPQRIKTQEDHTPSSGGVIVYYVVQYS